MLGVAVAAKSTVVDPAEPRFNRGLQNSSIHGRKKNATFAKTDSRASEEVNGKIVTKVLLSLALDTVLEYRGSAEKRRSPTFFPRGNGVSALLGNLQGDTDCLNLSATISSHHFRKQLLSTEAGIGG